MGSCAPVHSSKPHPLSGPPTTAAFRGRSNRSMPTLVYRQSSDVGNPFDSLSDQQASATLTPIATTSQSKVFTQTKSAEDSASDHAPAPPEATESAQPTTSSNDNSQSDPPSPFSVVSNPSPSVTPIFSQSAPPLNSVSTSAIIIDPTSSSTTTKPVATNIVVPPPHRAAIAGGVVGGLVAFALLLFAGYMVMRRRKKLRRVADDPDPTSIDFTQKRYLNLDMQQNPQSPPEFFPREYTGPWQETDVKFKSTSHMI